MKIDSFYFKYHNDKTIMPIPTYVISFYDLTVVFDGQLDYLINNKFVSVKKNGILLIPPNTKRERINIMNKADYVSFNFYCDTPLELPLLMNDIADEKFIFLAQVCNSTTENFSPEYFDIINGVVLTAISLIKYKTAETKYHDLTNKLIKYMSDNYKNKIKLKDICKEVLYSESYCNAVFKHDTGFSIVDYLIKLRITAAKRLLIENELSFQKIADATGFYDQNYFSRMFKKVTGFSPLNFQKKFRNK